MGKSDEQDWRAEASERFKEKQQKGRFKLSEGLNTIRILPRVGGKKPTPFFEYMVHREVGPNKRFMRCGKNLHNEGDCWLCDTKIPSLVESGDSAKQKRATVLQAKEQFVVQVATVDTDSGKIRGPFLWTVPTGGARSLAARLLGVLKSTKRDYIHPTKGYNITIERTGTGMTDTTYGQIEPDEDSSKVPEKILVASKPFSQLIPAYSEEQQKAAYFGRDAVEEEEEEEEPKKKKKPVDEDEDEPEAEEEETPKKKKKPADEDEEEESAEEEEEETPKKKKKPAVEDEEEEATEEEEDETPKKKKKPVDEDEDEPAEEEEEEETPKKKKKPVDEDEEPEEEEDEAPKKKKKPADEEEEEPEEEEEDEKPKKKKKHQDEDEEEEEEHPKKKKKPVDEDE